MTRDSKRDNSKLVHRRRAKDVKKRMYTPWWRNESWWTCCEKRRNLKTGQHKNTNGAHERALAASERLTQEESLACLFWLDVLDMAGTQCVKNRPQSRIWSWLFAITPVKKCQQISDIWNMQQTLKTSTSSCATKLFQLWSGRVPTPSPAHPSWKAEHVDRAQKIKRRPTPDI